MYLYIRLRCNANVCVALLIAIDWIFVLLAEASGCHRYFAHMDCLTVDEMEKYMVYDSGADCRGIESFLFFFSFFSYYVQYCVAPLLWIRFIIHISPVLIQFCWIKNQIFADTRCQFLFFICHSIFIFTDNSVWFLLVTNTETALNIRS